MKRTENAVNAEPLFSICGSRCFQPKGPDTWKIKNRNKGRKYAVLEMLDLTYTDFSEEFNKYVMEQIIQESQDISKLEEIIRLTQGQKMIYAIACLKEREKKLIFGRVFEELEFEELGKRLGITGKQAEMAYYYVIRKMRRRMEGTTDEF